MSKLRDENLRSTGLNENRESRVKIDKVIDPLIEDLFYEYGYNMEEIMYLVVERLHSCIINFCMEYSAVQK